ncbi:MAG: hypothetical protein CL840_13280 [Crocinitomicaceae bacterium]|nr:hypothetical protein [Crocinitomicaceae bacterium]|tara:strand:- start:466 stop:1164 length:699 start_codon:yes stop_codon:yes gene_type:complete
MKFTEKKILDIQGKILLKAEKILIDKIKAKSGLKAYRNSKDLQHLKWVWVEKPTTQDIEIELQIAPPLTVNELGEQYLHPTSLKMLTHELMNTLNDSEGTSKGIFQFMRPEVNLDYNWFYITYSFSSKLNSILAISTRVNEFEIDTHEKVIGDYVFLSRNYFKFVQLTPVQLKILGMLAAGKTNKEIAAHISISPNTVRTHRNNIHKTLGMCWKPVHPLITYLRYAQVFGLI